MKRLTFILAVAACVLCFAEADAKEKVLSGTVVIEKDLRVEKGDTLRLKPGARLHFKEGAGMSVEGTLEAGGEPGRRITFTPAKRGARWTGIRVAPDGDVFLKNILISGAQEAVSVSGGRLRVNAVEVRDSEKGITLEKAAEADIEGLKSSAITRAAVSVRQDSKAALMCCALSGPGGIGLSVTGRCSVEVGETSFKGLESGVRATYPGASPKISGCSFTGNKYGAYAEYPEAGPFMSQCRFSRNTYAVYSKRLSAPALDGCVITQNEYGLYVTEGSSAQARGCRINKNRYGVYVTFSSYPRVNGCDLSGNTAFAAYLDEQSYDWVSANGDAQRRQQMGMRAMAAGRRGSETRRQGMEAARYVNPKGGCVDFQGNYWGPEAARDMASSTGMKDIGGIYDYFDKNTDIYDGKSYVRDKVDYSGYLADSPFH